MFVAEKEERATGYAGQPTVEQIRAGVSALGAVLRSRAQTVEAERRVPMQNIEALREIGHLAGSNMTSPCSWI